MNRIWIFLCFLCIPWAARGQSAYEWRYWFDDAKNQQQTGQGSGAAFSISADAAVLGEGLHAIYVQIADTAGRFSPPLSQLFYRVGDRTVKQLRYCFDTDREVIGTAPIAGSHATLDVKSLEPGLHFVYCQAEDAMGNVSDVSSSFFYCPMRTDKATWSYWFDDDREARQTVAQPDGPVLIDVSALADGFHTIYQQVSEKTPSAVVSRWFIKIPQTEGSADMTCICTVNEKLVGQQRVPSTGGVISWDLDVSALPVGLHRAVFQVITASGAASTIAERFFVRAITPAEVGRMKCVYTLDNSDTKAEAGTMAGGLFHFDLDVSSLEEGLHRIAYMMVAEDGSTTPQQTAFFWKTPVGGNGIVQYDYWLNDEEQALRSVHLDKRENPFRLITLLPIDAQPLRSSCFHFEVVNGQPTIYAKNDLHVRFYDTAARCLSDTRQFVDYQVGQKVNDVETLEPNVTATTDKPAENSIKWYKLTAVRGDSLSLRASAACTVQLFAPSGNEVYAASGSEVVVWGGIHAEESGTYYVALHDVTATQGTTISLDYERIDRYAVLRQDVATVGNGGPSTITFQGNGFDELTSADLVLGSTTIASTEIKAEGKAAVSVKWDFTDVPTGQYKAVFHFAEGDVTVEKCITVEEAVPVSMSSTVSYASQFLVSTGNTYNYKVRNHGNMTAYDVPMTLTVYASDSQLLQWVKADGVELAEYASVETLKKGYVYARRYQLTRTLRPSTTEPLAVRVKTSTTGHIYVDLDGVGGPSEAVTAIDPNDIYGYQDEQGDRTIRDGRTQVYYTIEFENDPEFATASAHEIRVTDVLSPELFDLSTFAPTRIKIGDKEAELSGEKSGLVTIDMRSEINAIAQVEWTFDEATGTAHWHISSLDPQTMEPSDDPMVGVLPVNVNGNGIGQLSFDISLKPGLPDGTEIPNRATIVFDGNEGIDTPTWVNTISSVLKGDVNGDGEVTAQDASLIQQYVARKLGDTVGNGFAVAAADVNGDGEVTAQDASLVQQYVARKISW